MPDRRASGGGLMARIARFYLEPADFEANEVRLTGASARRLRDVLRVRAGQRVHVFDGLGAEREADVADVSRGSRGTVTIVLGAPRASRLEPPVPLTLVCAFPRGSRGDWIVEKATELGVARIVPRETGRSVMRPGDGRLARWRRVAIEAAEQCGRSVVPAIGGEASSDAVQLLVDLDAPQTIREALDATAASALPASALVTAGLTLHVGPEGGWDASERGALLESGALPVHLGPRTLRVETAAVVAVAQALEATGGLSR